MGTGLTLESYVKLKLKLKPPPEADRAFCEPAEPERDEILPIRRVAAALHLRSPGYGCKRSTLELQFEDGVVTPTASDAWTQADVDSVEAHHKPADAATTPALSKKELRVWALEQFARLDELATQTTVERKDRQIVAAFVERIEINPAAKTRVVYLMADLEGALLRSSTRLPIEEARDRSVGSIHTIDVSFRRPPITAPG